MVSGKLGLRMTTLHEETSNAGNQVTTPVHDEDEEKSDADYSEYDSYQVVHVLKNTWKISMYILYIRIVLYIYIHDYYVHFSLKIWMVDFEDRDTILRKEIFKRIWTILTSFGFAIS